MALFIQPLRQGKQKFCARLLNAFGQRGLQAALYRWGQGWFLCLKQMQALNHILMDGLPLGRRGKPQCALQSTKITPGHAPRTPLPVLKLFLEANSTRCQQNLQKRLRHIQTGLPGGLKQNLPGALLRI